MKLLDANLKIILDSRGQETLEAELKTDKFSVLASVPSGKSKGKNEALVLEPKKALEKFEQIKPQILNRKLDSQEEFDNFLISLDATPNKQNLGANLTLALSLAWAKLKAKSENLELFQYINQISNLKFQISNLPRPVFNVINGGAHSGFSRQSKPASSRSAPLDFQEFQIIPEVKDFSVALGLGQEFYEKLRQFLEKKFGKENIFLGDEAGFSGPFKNNEEAIEILMELILKYKYPLRIGLDIAASQFYQRPTTNDQRHGLYLVDDKKYSTEELKNFYLKLVETYNILLLEDPFYEEDFDSFASLIAEIQCRSKNSRSSEVEDQYRGNRMFQTLVITDDLTTTSFKRLKTAIEKKAGNAILIKPNQIGTLTETLKVVGLAYENNWQAIVSHRSGETADDFIADLAVAINAWGIKAGAPATPERMAKYDRVLEILISKS